MPRERKSGLFDGAVIRMAINAADATRGHGNEALNKTVLTIYKDPAGNSHPVNRTVTFIEDGRPDVDVLDPSELAITTIRDKSRATPFLEVSAQGWLHVAPDTSILAYPNEALQAGYKVAEYWSNASPEERAQYGVGEPGAKIVPMHNKPASPALKRA